MKNRGKLDDTLAAMFSNSAYREDYLFYAHMIGMCSIKIRTQLPAAAGVSFNIDHFNLYINPTSKWVDINKSVDLESIGDDIKTVNGKKMIRIVKGFDDYTITQRLAILKHEMLHILYKHITTRRENYIHEPWNYATDCALNQHINTKHLPDGCIIPDTLSKLIKADVPENQSSEFYYELIKDKCSVVYEKGKESGDHTIWEESIGDEELQQDMTKKMIENAQNETIKSKGNVPNECNVWLELHTRISEVNWKKVLRGIVGNKRIGTRSTIMRQDRRFPNRQDLRGKIKDRKFNLLVIVDVSGSMSDKAIVTTLGEVSHICNFTKTDVDLIQIDTEAYLPEKLSKTTKTVSRKGSGGTEIHSALDMAYKHNIDYQAVVVLTDGCLFDDDITYFQRLKKKVIWLIESEGNIMDEMNTGRMQAFKLSK